MSQTCVSCNREKPCVSPQGLIEQGWTLRSDGWMCFMCEKTLLDEEVAARTVTVASQPSPGPQNVEEAKMFHEGFIAGLTAYAAAVGHSGLRANNETLRDLMDKQSWETIEAFERLTGRRV